MKNSLRVLLCLPFYILREIYYSMKIRYIEKRGWIR